jgi:hypothetical protein
VALNLSIDSLRWALDQALNYGDTDVFPLPFEFRAIDHGWRTIGPWLASRDVTNWECRPHRIMLSPKGRFAFRNVTQLDPLDFLIFTALIYEISGDLEVSRVPIGDNIVFAFRFAPDADGRAFDPAIGFSQFRDECERILNEEGFGYVAVADIADFYPRIYHHRLENALLAATRQTQHVRAIMRLLGGWNEKESYGIPVGNAASRLLGEITISDVDQALLAHGIRFVRFNDDYRLFCNSPAEAYGYLSVVANYLNTNHGLSLQPLKTKTVAAETFRTDYLPTPEDRERNSVRERFAEFIDQIELEEPYGEVEYDDLDLEQQELIDSLNLAQLFREELESELEDLSLLRFILRRLGQLGDDGIVELALGNLERLYPIIPEIITYLGNLRHLTPDERTILGERVLLLLDHPIVRESEYFQLWVLNIFADSTNWNNEDRFLNRLNAATFQAARRKLILALGRANRREWFQSRWRHLFDEPPWTKRALLAAASCMPGDARTHWYRSVRPRLDDLERVVADWAQANPFA